jgi:23S rRNA pseudouridine2604 synthase
MCEHLGYEVVALKRIRIMSIKLDVALGRYRELTSDEVNQLNQLLLNSEKTATT